MSFDWAAEKVDAWRRFRWRDNRWVIIAFAIIIIVGAYFRLANLDGLPKEMYPDHADAIFDVFRIGQGHFEIMYTPRRDAREPLHYFLTALLSKSAWSLGMNHFTLKLAAALESILTLPLLFWAGLELMGERDRKFGLVVGLLVAGMVAVSFWHVVHKSLCPAYALDRAVCRNRNGFFGTRCKTQSSVGFCRLRTGAGIQLLCLYRQPNAAIGCGGGCGNYAGHSQVYLA